MKTLAERSFQYAVLALSAVIAFVFIMPLAKSAYPAADEKFVVPLTTGVLYMLMLALFSIAIRLPFLRGRLDNRSIFVGEYISCPPNRDRLSVFRIQFDAWKQKYSLNGASYSLSKQKPLGAWSSSFIDFDVSNRRVTYIYDGNSEERTDAAPHPAPGGTPKGGRKAKAFNGHGYVRIEFFDPKMKNGSGYFIDDGEPPVRVKTRYTKLTRDVRKALAKSSRAPGRKDDWAAVVKCFAALSPDEQDRYR